jgi:hypothetical protein
MAASSSEADEPESNRSSARAKAWVTLLPPTEVEDVFFPVIFMFTEEVFSVILSPEDCATKFLLGFIGLAKESSCVEVWVLEQDDPIAHLHFSEAFHGIGAGTAATNLCFCTMGSV